jgi:hypothetical protein
MNDKLAWYIARGSGLVAWALLAAAVLWGLLLASGMVPRRPKRAWWLDLHRFLGGTAVAFTVVHVAALVGDSYATFGPVEILVPLASHWRPWPVAAGVVTVYLLVAVEGDVPAAAAGPAPDLAQDPLPELPFVRARHVAPGRGRQRRRRLAGAARRAEYLRGGRLPDADARADAEEGAGCCCTGSACRSESAGPGRCAFSTGAEPRHRPAARQGAGGLMRCG